MSKREIAAAAAKKYILSTTNTTASAPPDRFHSVMTLITLGKAEEAENIDREKFLRHLEVWTQSANTTDTNSDSRDDKARKAKEDT